MNGVLLGYRVNYSLFKRRRKRNSKKNEFYSVTLPPNMLRYEIKDLRKFAQYSITVAGFNSKGSGPSSVQISIKTGEDGKTIDDENINMQQFVKI